MIGGPFDGAQLPSPLALTDSEFSWYIFETAGGPRRLAGLVSLHRTGPRPRSLALGPQLVAARDLPPPLSDLVPAWLPILSPVRVTTDDRPLFMVAVYDLDARVQPLVIEHEIEHADFDPARFAATALGGALSLRIDDDGTAAIHARTERLSLDLRARPIKPAVVFGDGSPTIRHGKITTSYVQRPRLDVTGEVHLGRERIAFAGDGVHDHQWLRVAVPNLKWIWPHLRLPDGRELTGYVIRDSTGSRHADADDGTELGRGAWVIERDSTVRRLERFELRASAHVDTERGRVPTRFAFDVPELALELAIAHTVPAPYLAMRAFGDMLDAGIYEGPVSVHDRPDLRGWVEIMNAAHVRLRLDPVAEG
jgi:hypothetical protein